MRLLMQEPIREIEALRETQYGRVTPDFNHEINETICNDSLSLSSHDCGAVGLVPGKGPDL